MGQLGHQQTAAQGRGSCLRLALHRAGLSLCKAGPALAMLGAIWAQQKGVNPGLHLGQAPEPPVLPPGLRAHGQLLSPRCTYEHQRPPLSFTLMHFAWHLPGAHDQLWMYKPSHAHIPLSLQGCFPWALCDADIASPEQAYKVRKAAASPGDSLQPPGDPALWICICPRIAWVWKTRPQHSQITWCTVWGAQHLHQHRGQGDALPASNPCNRRGSSSHLMQPSAS